MQIRFLHWGGGGDNRSNFTKICNITSLGVMTFQLSKNLLNLKSKRKLSNLLKSIRKLSKNKSQYYIIITKIRNRTK